MANNGSARCFALGETVTLAREATIDLRDAAEARSVRRVTLSLQQSEDNLLEANNLRAQKKGVSKAIATIHRIESSFLRKRDWKKLRKDAALLAGQLDRIFDVASKSCGGKG